MDWTAVFVGLGGPLVGAVSAYVALRYQRDFRARIKGDQELVTASLDRDAPGMLLLRKSIDERALALSYFERVSTFSRFWRIPMFLGLGYFFAGLALILLGIDVGEIVWRVMAVVWGLVFFAVSVASFRLFMVQMRARERESEALRPVADHWDPRIAPFLTNVGE
nr:hypothetical protein [uncultured Rhodococcus sp.]